MYTSGIDVFEVHIVSLIWQSFLESRDGNGEKIYRIMFFFPQVKASYSMHFIYIRSNCPFIFKLDLAVTND